MPDVMEIDFKVLVWKNTTALKQIFFVSIITEEVSKPGTNTLQNLCSNTKTARERSWAAFMGQIKKPRF